MQRRNFQECNLFLNPFAVAVAVAVWWYAALLVLLSPVYLAIFRKPIARELWYTLIAFYDYQYPPYGWQPAPSFRGSQLVTYKATGYYSLLHFTYWNVCRLLTIENVFHCHEFQIEYLSFHIQLYDWCFEMHIVDTLPRAGVGDFETLIWKSDLTMNPLTWRRHFNFRHLTALATVQLFVVLTNNSFQK